MRNYLRKDLEFFLVPEDLVKGLISLTRFPEIPRALTYLLLLFAWAEVSRRLPFWFSRRRLPRPDRQAGE